MLSRAFITSLLLEASMVSAFPNIAEQVAAQRLAERNALLSFFR